MKGVIIHVLALSEEQQKLSSQGILDEDNIVLDTTKKMTFYNIDYVCDYDGKRCILSSGGEDFIANESEESVNQKIRAAQMIMLN